MEKLINNLVNSKCQRTEFGNSMYSNLWYVNTTEKICFTFSPRGGCSVAFQHFLDLSNLLADGLNFNNFIHEYRVSIYDPNTTVLNINDLIEQKYTFIKFVINPYLRAVSIFYSQTSHNLSFRSYLKDLINNNTSYLNDNDIFHLHNQYIKGEEKIITKYICVNENETYTIQLSNGEKYLIDLTKFNSNHHIFRNNINKFVGDVPRKEIILDMPINYKYFYDEEIKTLVETYYKDDLINYNFKVDVLNISNDISYSIYNNKLNNFQYKNLPVDFDPKIYKKINIDLYNMSDVDAKNHYENYGFYENRQYKYNKNNHV